MKKQIQFLVLVSSMLCSFVHGIKAGEKMISLKNEKIEVGVIPEPGGRVVLLRKPGLNNILKSEPIDWDNPQALPQVSAFADFKAYNGHIVWLSPQSEWWLKQAINLERRDNKAIWPPDPYLIYGDYKITARSQTSITMIGPESPVSGVQLTKTVSIDSAGGVTFEAVATNIRSEPVAWGLWLNTRLDGRSRCYVPAKNSDLIRLAGNSSSTEHPLPHRFIAGYFTFDPEIPADRPGKYVQKAFIKPAAAFMVGFSQGQMLYIGFDQTPVEKIHSDQAPVEVYNLVHGAETLLELELHGPYLTIPPGTSIRLSEFWQVFKYDGKNSPEDQIQFINQCVKGKW